MLQRLFFLFIFFSSQIFSECGSEHASLFPTSLEEVHLYVEGVKKKVHETVACIVAVPIEEKTFDNTLKPLNKLGWELLKTHSTLSFISTSDLPSRVEGLAALKELYAYLGNELLRNHELIESVASFTHRACMDAQSHPYENYIVLALLENAKNHSSNLEKTALEALSHLAKRKELEPFLHKTGHCPEKKLNGYSITLLTLNTCFLPSPLSWIHGGVAPWECRIGSLTQKLLELSPDVICLQEVFTEEGNLALYDALKEHYSHFYIGIGPRSLGLELDSFGLPSGLFVASKYPIDKPHFKLFSESGIQVNYGCFDFTLLDNKKPLAHIYTAHLQAFGDKNYPQIREKQLGEILTQMKRDAKADKKNPFLLVGDLNIPCNSNEAAEKLLKKHFYDAYNDGRTIFAQSECTCTEYFIRYFTMKGDVTKITNPRFEILDYVLLFNKKTAGSVALQTKLIPMNMLSEPISAISDHHGLLSTITILK